MILQVRTDAPYCRACGGTEPFHWPRTDGERCPIEPVFAGRMNEPGAALTAPAQATPEQTGDDEMNDSPQREVP